MDDRFWVHYRADDTPWFISFSGGELCFPEDCLIVNFYPDWLYPEEVLPRPKDERFADTEPDGLKWNARSWWYDTGNFGSIGIVVRAIAEVWQVDLANLLDAMEPLHFDEDSDNRFLVPLSGGGAEPVEMVRVFRPNVIAISAAEVVGEA